MSGPAKNVKRYHKTKTHFIKSLDLNDVITPEDPEKSKFTASKLVGTIGPSCQNVDTLCSMLELGMAAGRIDLAWGPLDFHRKSLESLNAAMLKTRRLCATVVDTLGREVMIRRPCTVGDDGWPRTTGPIEVKVGQTVTLTTRMDVEASSTVLPVTYAQFSSMAEKGDTVYIGRYLVCGADSASLYLEVKEVQGDDIICEAKNSAVMDGLMTVFHMERSSDSLLNLQNTLPLLSEYDREAIAALGREFEIDFICLSYTRTSEDVREARKFLDSIGMQSTRIIAKMETRQSLLNFRGILSEADAVVMSRGNLGLDIVPEKMALVQKMLIQSCNLVGKPCLITRVVDSMVTNPRPTRAEATDIANAVLDGADGFMLGAETLRGGYPVEAVDTISQICRVAESVFDYHHHYEHLMESAFQAEQEEKRRQSDSEPGTPTYEGNHLGMSPDESYSDLGNSKPNTSYGALDNAIHAFAKFGGAGSVSGFSMAGKANAHATSGMPLLSKMESLASSAVRAAGKVDADLIIVYTASGRTAQLVAKYRPPMPIITLVVPRLVNDSLHWRLEGRSTARICLLTRGLLPILATPGPNGDAVLEAAVVQAARQGLVRPNNHVIIVQQIHEDFCVKVMSVDSGGKVARRTSQADVRRKGRGNAVSEYDSEDESYMPGDLGITASLMLPTEISYGMPSGEETSDGPDSYAAISASFIGGPRPHLNGKLK